MLPKVFVSPDNMATFICPQCEKPRRADVSKFGALEHAVRINVKCPCGHRYRVNLERRQYRRKTVNFAGVVLQVDAGRETGRWLMAVKDLSRTGLRLRVSQTHPFSPGDTLQAEFRLDDARRSHIRKEAVVRQVRGRDISARFTSVRASDPSDKALGFYFLS